MELRLLPYQYSKFVLSPDSVCQEFPVHVFKKFSYEPCKSHETWRVADQTPRGELTSGLRPGL